MLCRCGFGSGGGFEGDPVAEGGELGDVVTHAAFDVDAAGVVVGSEVAEAGEGVGEQVVGSPEGVSPSGSHRSVREPLGSYGSCHLDHQTAGTAVVQAQCAKNRGYASVTRCHARWSWCRPLNRRYFLRTQRIR